MGPCWGLGWHPGTRISEVTSVAVPRGSTEVGVGWSWLVEPLPTMCEALGLILGTTGDTHTHTQWSPLPWGLGLFSAEGANNPAPAKALDSGSAQLRKQSPFHSLLQERST